MAGRFLKHSFVLYGLGNVSELLGHERGLDIISEGLMMFIQLRECSPSATICL